MSSPLTPKLVSSLHASFAKANANLSVIRAPFSLLDRSALAVREQLSSLNIRLLADDPLGPGGIGAGVCTAMDPTGGELGKPRFAFRDLDALLGLHQALRTAAEMATRRLRDEWAAGGESGPAPDPATTSQVGINFVRSFGFVALPSCVTAKEAKDCLAATKWSLAPDEMQVLEKAADEWARE